jgi:preprotein translocase subunit SecG
MATFILIIHIIVCIFLVFIVLIQSGKGAELGAAFGGSGQTLFGARGAATIFSKMTTIAAILFMLTSLSLAVVTTKGSSVIKTAPVAPEQKKNIPQGQAPLQGLPSQPAAPTAAPVVPAAPAPTAK